MAKRIKSNGSVVVLRSAGMPECPTCGSDQLQTRWEDREFQYGTGDDAVTLKARVPVHVCTDCKLEFTDHVAEDSRHRAVCKHLGIMTPSEIVALRESLNMSRAQFARMSGIGEASFNRWENGQLTQSASIDRYLYLLSFRDNIERLERRSERPSDQDGGNTGARRWTTAQFRRLSSSQCSEIRKSAAGFSLCRVSRVTVD